MDPKLICAATSDPVSALQSRSETKVKRGDTGRCKAQDAGFERLDISLN